MGIVSLMMLACLSAMLFPVRTPDMAPKSICLSHLKQLGLAALLYAGDSNDFLPPKDWCSALKPYTKNEELYSDPVIKGPAPQYGYAFNSKWVAKKTIESGADKAVLFFDSAVKGRSVVQTLRGVENPPRHMGKNNFVYMDSHVWSFAVSPEEPPSVKKTKG